MGTQIAGTEFSYLYGVGSADGKTFKMYSIVLTDNVTVTVGMILKDSTSYWTWHVYSFRKETGTYEIQASFPNLKTALEFVADNRDIFRRAI